MKRLVSGIMLTLLMLGTLTLTFNVQPARSSAATITVPDDYATIQAAINAANSGDTIYVRNGFYKEHIQIINKTITLMGESNQRTIIEPLQVGASLELAQGIFIEANNTKVENFNIVATDGLYDTESKSWSSLIFIDGRTGAGGDSILENIITYTIGNGTSGILEMLGSFNTTVAGNHMALGDFNYGVVMTIGSEHNLIDNNTITGGWSSVYCAFCNDNIISNNFVTNQTLGPDPVADSTVGGITVFFSSGDIIRENTLTDNYLGVSFYQADCSVYHNNFMNNAEQVFVDTSNVAWSNGYASGGNYWSDYNGTDSFNGPYQNRTGSDGIGDTPYVNDASNVDHYPLMKPWAPRILGDVNGDGTVDLKDLVLLAYAYGSTPGCINWDGNADLDGDGRVSLTDLVTLATHYGQHNP